MIIYFYVNYITFRNTRQLSTNKTCVILRLIREKTRNDRIIEEI